MDRPPWPGGPDSTVLSDGASGTAVVTSSILVVDDDGTTTLRLVENDLAVDLANSGVYGAKTLVAGAMDISVDTVDRWFSGRS